MVVPVGRAISQNPQLQGTENPTQPAKVAGRLLAQVLKVGGGVGSLRCGLRLQMMPLAQG